MHLQIAILAMLIACSTFSPGKPERFNFNSQVGVVDASAEGKLCLNISNPNLVAGAPVSFILPHKPQRVAKATIEQKLASSCSHDPNTTSSDASFYSLKLVGKAVDLSEPMPPAIAVVRSATPVLLKHGIASADLDGDGRTEFFRICTSNEGNHLTVWSGKPLQGKRSWHSYYYLGYDVVPTCKKKDYQ
jgi:hypothetical protein